jgi:hypothetical protein
VADALGNDVVALKQRTHRARRRAKRAAQGFAMDGADLGPPLLAAMTPDERVVIEPVIVENGPSIGQTNPMVEAQLTYRPPTLRPRR